MMMMMMMMTTMMMNSLLNLINYLLILLYFTIFVNIYYMKAAIIDLMVKIDKMKSTTEIKEALGKIVIEHDDWRSPSRRS
jgi:hypothetical protein